MKFLIDLDGTLLDARARMFALFEELTGTGRFTRDEYWAHKRTPTSHAKLLAAHFGYDRDAIAAFERRWLEGIETEASLGRDTLFDDTASALATLAGRGELYVLTARQDAAAARAQLERLGIAHLFVDVLVTGRGRGKDQAVRDAGLSLHAEDVLIGDTAEDIATARALGLRSVALTGGFRAAEYLRAASPDALFPSIGAYADSVSTPQPAPMVSVAVVTYNQAHLIGACLDSILAQDIEDFEIVVADDGSSDGTRDVVRGYAERHPGRFVLAFAERNGGVTANHNGAIAACRGRYVAFIGGDDLMLPGKLRAQVALMEADPGCSLCYHDLDVFVDTTNQSLGNFSATNTPRTGDGGQLVRYGTVNGACATMVRRSATPERGFDPRILIASDWLFWVETALAGRVAYIPEVLGRYRRSQGSITASGPAQRQLFEDHLISCMIILARHPAYASEVAQIAARHCVSLGRRTQGAGRFGLFALAPALLMASIATWPLSFWRRRRAAGATSTPKDARHGS